jgi:hypothetical protein
MLAKVVFWGPEKAGRSTPPTAGYQPQIDAGGVYTSCRIKMLGREQVFEFDREYHVWLELLFPDEYGSRFSVGQAVDFYEGSKQIGTGTIIATP